MLDDAGNLYETNNAFSGSEPSLVRRSSSRRELLSTNKRKVLPILSYLSRREEHKKSL
jgi:hypothetical protein